MVHFENRVWNIVKKSEQLTGFWPFQNKFKNYALRMLLCLLLQTYFFALMLRLIEEWDNDLAIVIENFITLLVVMIILTKLLNACVQGKKRREIYEQVAAHFEIIVDEDEVKILKDYADKGLRFTLQAAVYIYLAAITYIFLPVIKMFLLYFFGHGKLEKKLPMFVDFLVDEQEYFYHILVTMLIISIAGGTAEFTFDLSFYTTVRHVCALFEIVKLRLKKASMIFEECDENNDLLDSDEETAFEMIVSAVNLHNETLNLSETLNKLGKNVWCAVILFNALMIPPLLPLGMIYKDDTFELCRRCLPFIIVFGHFFIIFLQGQIITDNSSSVFDACYEFYWFKASKRSQVAISIMMNCSLTPCTLSGGNIFYLSMETYAVMLKTCVSYISMFTALDW